MKTCVVLGSNCFSGSHLIDALMDDPRYRVIGVSRSPEPSDLYLPYKRRSAGNFSFHRCDLAAGMDEFIPWLDEIRPDIIVNFAALSEVFQSNLTPEEYYRINCSAVVQLSNALRSRDYLERYVHISSAEVYGNCSRPVSESEPLRPTTPYAASKAAADMYLATLIRHFRFPAVIIRSTNVYGMRQQLYKIIPRTVIRLRLDEKIELHGGGLMIRPFVHIRDVVAGIKAVIERGNPGEIHHFSTDLHLSISDVVRRICEALEYDFDESTTAVDERSGQDQAYLLDDSKARRELGWEPKISFDEGLEEVIRWIDRDWDAILAETLTYIHRP